MQIRKVFFALFVLLIVSCSHKKEVSEVPPDSVFTNDSMKMLLVDFFLTESIIRQLERDGKNVATYTNQYYDLLMQKYHSDTLKISRSYKYYSQRPQILKELSDKALDSLIIVETMLMNDTN